MSGLDELLPRWEALWRRQGAPIADQLAPGLHDAELDRRQSEAGLVFPAEIRQWWRWHDGVVRRQPGTRLGIESRLGVGPWEFLSCVEALHDREVMLGITGDSDLYWRRSWLPILAFDANLVYVDCATDGAPGVSVQLWAREPDDPFRARLPSWTAAVAMWVRLAEDGYFSWSTTEQHWVSTWPHLPEVDRATGLL